MNITRMFIQMQRHISFPNGRQKLERNMETDTADTDIYLLSGDHPVFQSALIMLTKH